MEAKTTLRSAKIPGAARVLGYFPIATVSLIGLNALVYLGMLPGDPQDTASWYGLIPSSFQWITLLTSLFIHFEATHLLANIFFLGLFGRKVESSTGPAEFLGLYLGGGLFASLVHVAIVSAFLHNQQNIPLVGASGAVSCIIGVYAFRFRAEKVHVRGRDLPTLPLILAWFLVQVALGLAGLNRPSIAGIDLTYVGYWSHIGGFVFGLTSAWLMSMHFGSTPKMAPEARRIENLRRNTLVDVCRRLEILASADPEEPFVFAELAGIRAQLGDQARSVSAYITAADLYRNLGMKDEGVAVLCEALRYWPEVTLERGGLFRIACLFEALDEPQEAASRLEWLADAARSEPEGEMALVKLAQIEIDRLSDPQSAVEHAERLVTEYPKSKWADAGKQILERAKKQIASA